MTLPEDKYQNQALGTFGATEENRIEEQRRLELYQQRKAYREVGK